MNFNLNPDVVEELAEAQRFSAELLQLFHNVAAGSSSSERDVSFSN